MKKILVIQTASIGDVILATPLLEKLHDLFPDSSLDVLIKNGNESLFTSHPYIHNLLIWNKKNNKYKNLLALLKTIRNEKYNLVINLQRFASSGFLTAFSGAMSTIGFNKNPFSIFFSKRISHTIGNKGIEIHEVDRNLKLLESFNSEKRYTVKLYPSQSDYALVSQFKTKKYICIAPASLWNTKQFPKERWIEFVKKIDKNLIIYFIGAKNDVVLCNEIIKESSHLNSINLSGKLSLLQSAALMKDAAMNYVNDSSPLHLASATNAKVTAIFCSTVTAFGFGPQSDNAVVVEVRNNLKCRPCGLHGFKKCPENHFKCAYEININELIQRIDG